MEYTYVEDSTCTSCTGTTYTRDATWTADSGVSNTFTDLTVTFPNGLSLNGLYGSANIVLGSSSETNVPLGVITSYGLSSSIVSWEYDSQVNGWLGLGNNRATNLISVMASGTGFSLEAFQINIDTDLGHTAIFGYCDSELAFT